MTGRKKVIAVLDDEPKMRLALGRLLGPHGYEVKPFESGHDFLKATPADRPDCMLLGLHIGEDDQPLRFRVASEEECNCNRDLNSHHGSVIRSQFSCLRHAKHLLDFGLMALCPS
jgi:DNA-binding NtrC family response regulator